MRNTRSAHRSSRHSKLLHTGTCSLRFLHQPRYSRGAPDTLHAAGSPPSTGQASCSTRTRRQATMSLPSSPPRGAATAAGAAAATAYMATRMSSRKGGWRCAAPSLARSGGDGARVETGRLQWAGRCVAWRLSPESRQAAEHVRTSAYDAQGVRRGARVERAPKKILRVEEG